ncbi:DUF1330 domain-containing protein [Dinoroseobacter sp. PD6]|uniref:DUF1330 domain-containing protein n=1 Tax=Dinoroseobacter sp. PD6 TaxID=3028384 RepID=UPI00237BA484|nr:DUF1330 domain-containing protein [Dinoroseobacter sp. PD6]MDD9715522.1 DUF1330 domain-containing protein [Dinoroseobacter sp. PD6]
MSAFWIAHVHVTDADRYGEYAKRATVAIAEHGGQFLARGGSFTQLEGPERERHVVVRFESRAQAEKCYASSAYQEALSYARGAAERELVIVDALDNT